MLHFSLMILPQVFDSQLLHIVESRPACVVTVCKHWRFESVCEYCVVNSFATSLILINLLSVGCSCVLNIIFVFIWCTFNRQRNDL